MHMFWKHNAENKFSINFIVLDYLNIAFLLMLDVLYIALYNAKFCKNIAGININIEDSAISKHRLKCIYYTVHGKDVFLGTRFKCNPQKE